MFQEILCKCTKSLRMDCMDIGHKVKDVEGYLRYFYFVVIRDEPFRCGSNSCLRSKDARREAKAVFKEPLPLTPFRAQECPTSCKTTECKTWGCKTELASWTEFRAISRSSEATATEKQHHLILMRCIIGRWYLTAQTDNEEESKDTTVTFRHQNYLCHESQHTK